MESRTAVGVEGDCDLYGRSEIAQPADVASLPAPAPYRLLCDLDNPQMADNLKARVSTKTGRAAAAADLYRRATLRAEYRDVGEAGVLPHDPSDVFVARSRRPSRRFGAAPCICKALDTTSRFDVPVIAMRE